MKKQKKSRIAVEPKKLLKNNNYKKANTESSQYCYCPDCRCQQCEN